MTTIIGLMGPAGAGKSSVAQYLVERYGARRYSFAGPLKELAMRTLDLTHEQCWGTQAQKEAVDPRYGFSPRWFLQRLGTEGCRKTFGHGFWVEQALAAVKRDAPALAVFEDARFINEAVAIRAFTEKRAAGDRVSGFVWCLDSPGRETEADSSHASEREWCDAPRDHLIKPEARGLDTLFGLVDEACRKFVIFPKRPEVSL